MNICVLVTILSLVFSQFLNASQFSDDEIALAVSIGITPQGRRLTSNERQAALSQACKDKKRIVSVDLFSKADLAHHKWGTSGEKTTVLVVEGSGICPDLFQLAPGQFVDVGDRYLYSKQLNKDAATEAVPNPVDFSHGTIVAHTLHQIAPGSTVCTVPKYISKTFTIEMVPEKLRKEAHVMNVSSTPFSMLYENDPLLPTLIHADPDNPKLVIFSSGNEGESGSRFGTHMFALSRRPDVWPHSILSISIDSRNSVESYSMIPGDIKELQDKSICSLGTTWSFPIDRLESEKQFVFKNLQKYQGTSFSAPIVTAAALLLESYLKERHDTPLSSSFAQEVLFNSACRTFIAMSDVLGFDMTLFYYDPEDEKYNLSAEKIKVMTDTYRQKYGFHLTKFDPVCYGQGILDIDNMLLYATLKLAHPQWDSTLIRAQMLKIDDWRKNRWAKKIQRAYKKYKTLRSNA